MIYKKQRVRGVRISAGQVVNAPVAPFLLRTVFGAGDSARDNSAPIIRFAGVKAPPVSRDSFSQSPYLISKYGDIFQALDTAQVVPDRPGEFHDQDVHPLSWDVSENTFIELRGEFESCPLVMLEGVLDASTNEVEKLWPMMRPLTYPNGILGASSEKVSGSTTVYPDAYVLLQDAYFSGEVIFHNTVQDRNTPFRWPVYFSELKVPLPMYARGEFYGAEVHTVGGLQNYVSAWAHSTIKPPTTVPLNSDDRCMPGAATANPPTDPRMWRTAVLDPTSVYPCLAVIVPTGGAHHDTTVTEFVGENQNCVRLRPLNQTMWATKEIACMARPDWRHYPAYEQVSIDPEKDVAGITLMFESSGPRNNAPFALVISTSYAVLAETVWYVTLASRSTSFAHQPNILVGPVRGDYEVPGADPVVLSAGMGTFGKLNFLNFSMKAFVDGIVNEQLVLAHDDAMRNSGNGTPGLWVLESVEAADTNKEG